MKTFGSVCLMRTGDSLFRWKQMFHYFGEDRWFTVLVNTHDSLFCWIQVIHCFIENKWFTVLVNTDDLLFCWIQMIHCFAEHTWFTVFSADMWFTVFWRDTCFTLLSLLYPVLIYFSSVWRPYLMCVANVYPSCPERDIAEKLLSTVGVSKYIPGGFDVMVRCFPGKWNNRYLIKGVYCQI